MFDVQGRRLQAEGLKRWKMGDGRWEIDDDGGGGSGSNLCL